MHVLGKLADQSSYFQYNIAEANFVLKPYY